MRERSKIDSETISDMGVMKKSYLPFEWLYLKDITKVVILY